MPERGVTLRPREAQALADAARRVSSMPSSQASARRTSHGSMAEKGTITIVNNTGDDLPVFSVVRVDRTVSHFTKGMGDSNDDAITSKSHYWEATAADSNLTGDYAVTVTPTLKGLRGSAIMTGVVRVRLDDEKEGEKADPIVLNTLGMVTGSSGKYPVLSVDVPGTNPTWGHVLLGGAGGEPSTFIPMKLSSGPYSVVIGGHSVYYYIAKKQIHSYPGVYEPDTNDTDDYRIVFAGIWGELPDVSLFTVTVIVSAELWGGYGGQTYYVVNNIAGPWAYDLQTPPLNVCYEP